jgi:CRISPR-associated protein Csm5
MIPFTAYRLHITPLSPVHIGTGESYEPTNYVIEDGALHEFDTGSAMRALSAEDRKELLRIASGNPNTQMLKALQRFFYERRQPLQAHAVNCIPVLPGIARLYDERIGKAANIEGNGGQVINRLEIDRTAYNPITRQPVLFGSSLKGAIRTALLDWKNQGQPLQAVKDYRSNQINKESNQALQQRLLDFRAGKFEFDPLRLAQLADTHWQSDAGLFTAAQVCLAVNRKKHPVKDTTGQLRKAMGENLYQILECVSGWRYRAFTGQINLQHLNGISDTDNRGERRLPAKDLRFGMAHIAQACNRFYLPALNSERKILGDQGFLDTRWSQSVSQALALAENKIKQGQAFLLRVGRHSGAESVTLNGARNGNIKIMKGKGQKPDYADAAKTLWLAAEEKDQRQNLIPFGWLLVEVEALDKPPEDWPELRELCEPHLKTAREFAKKRESQREALEKARIEAEARRHKEEALAQQKAEAEEAASRAEAERQARIDAMSAEQKRILALQEQLTPASKGRGNGHTLFNTLKELIAEAAAWSAEDKALLKDAAAKAYEHLGVKKDNYKKLLRSLSE